MILHIPVRSITVCTGGAYADRIVISTELENDPSLIIETPVGTAVKYCQDNGIGPFGIQYLKESEEPVMGRGASLDWSD